MSSCDKSREKREEEFRGCEGKHIFIIPRSLPQKKKKGIQLRRPGVQTTQRKWECDRNSSALGGKKKKLGEDRFRRGGSPKGPEFIISDGRVRQREKLRR